MHWIYYILDRRLQEVVQFMFGHSMYSQCPKEDMIPSNTSININWVIACMNVTKLINFFPYLSHGAPFHLSIWLWLCYLIVAPLNHEANLHNSWKLDPGKVPWWCHLDSKLEVPPQSWFAIFTVFHFVLIIMHSCPLSAVNSQIFCKHFPCTDVLIEQIFPAEYYLKARAHHVIKYPVLIRTLNFTNCANSGKLYNVFKCHFTYLKSEVNDKCVPNWIVMMLHKRLYAVLS